jgi:very-short-patch-repair endonuclease
MGDRDRTERHMHHAADPACDELATERPEPRTREPEEGACDETAALEPLDRTIARQATSQSGPITRQQLAAAGLTQSAVNRRAAKGALHRVYRGVFLVGHEALAPRARETAALLAAGERAVISHASAAHLWGFAALDDEGVHVTVVGRRRRSRQGLIVHYATSLDPLDVRRLHGLPLTAPARTLFDLAATGYPQLERAFGEAHAQRLVTAREIEDMFERAGPRAGTRALRALQSDNASGFTRSKAERVLRGLLRDANLPTPRFNAKIAGYEVDAVWPDRRLVVEVDGYAYHGHRAQFERDRRKDLALTAAGYRVIRISWRQLTQEPFALIAVISSALSDSRKPG